MDHLRLLYAQSGFPHLQNRVYDTCDEARACRTGDIALVEDLTTGLVRNAAFRPEDVVYDTAYNNEQATSGRFRAHLESVASLVETHLGREALIEVGCGKGFFLEMLQRRGVAVTGFDPTYDGTNPAISPRYFNPELGLSGAGLVLRHVLEHVPDPVGFLAQLRDANGGRGLIYIEVPCLDWIVANRAWMDIFYEHVNYFRMQDFRNIFGRVVFAAHSFGGQYLSVVADLASLRAPAYDAGRALAFPDDFAAGAAGGDGLDPPRVVWGAASKGVIFSLVAERAGQPVDRIIDINPAKQGRHLPVTGLRVLSPAEGLADLPDGTTILVMNPNYLAEVQEMAGPRFNCKGA